MARFCICQQQKSSFLTLSQDERSKRLLEAAADGQVRQLELLIQAEANLDYQEDEGKTALQKAVLSNSQDCVELLLENRANSTPKIRRIEPLFISLQKQVIIFWLSICFGQAFGVLRCTQRAPLDE